MKKVHLYKKLYEKNYEYKRNLLPMFSIINASINFECKTFLDYGCGRGNLTDYFIKYRNCKTFKYDPAIKEYSNLDKNIKVDLIANCDVMEHIPENEVENVIKEMSNISNKVFFNIYLKEAQTFLPNGENAHCTVKPILWWLKKINKYFNNVQTIPTTYKNSVTIITWKISYK